MLILDPLLYEETRDETFSVTVSTSAMEEMGEYLHVSHFHTGSLSQNKRRAALLGNSSISNRGAHVQSQIHDTPVKEFHVA